jgi:hypothetical protein
MKLCYAMDPSTGTTYLVEYNASDDSITWTEVADVTQLLERNKRLYNDAPTHWKGDLHDIAGLHPIMRQKLEREGILHDKKAYARWLNDSDNRAWRTRPGKV